MEYYNPIDSSSKRYAAIITAVVMLGVALLVGLVEVEVIAAPKIVPPLEIVFEEVAEMEEPKRQPQQSAPAEQRRDLRPAHAEEAKAESSNQTSGEAERTATVNPNALFKPTIGNSAESVPAGNRLAPDGQEEQNRGEGTGYNLQGTDQLDAGLQGRGLREGLPKPATRYNTAGRVVVYVTIDSEGNVLTANVDLDGTTTSDATLRRLAVEAAMKAKFKPSSRTEQGGKIRYDFKLH